MTTHHSNSVPRVDSTVDDATIRDEAERIAVPDFDYIGQPIDAIVDGVTGHGKEHDEDSEDTTVD
ncbi:hypothetical protein Daura_35610 [Dactylosporangium aurantiacum]|uniref:Uncharacterized protein n=1 Tax=Dactylosporangium aurantiacum TaxID=35754 RepID=A0A9Q9MDE5_9ACTN|nr:hypothetical protein [Dactylosporangium aurantiacum]MDG6103500.1 hypothetical protein [Dactylosporangium aurantiacum]UWZ51999.1 hypothetical protein Daura_35610 [Dactylosporangium aurantiacum]